MSLKPEKPNFERQHLGFKPKLDTFTIRFNDIERKEFDIARKQIKQPKDSTALKQLAWIGINVLQDQKIAKYLEIILGNLRKNKERGIIDFD